MKVGDLVKMKHDGWWNPELQRRDYTSLCGIVYGIAGRGLKVLMPNSTIKLGLIDHWEVVGTNNESR